METATAVETSTAVESFRTAAFAEALASDVAMAVPASISAAVIVSA
jgi:hypothetical protein